MRQALPVQGRRLFKPRGCTSDEQHKSIVNATVPACQRDRAQKRLAVGVAARHLRGSGKEDDGLLPHDAAVAVLHVVHLVEDHPRQLTQQLRPPETMVGVVGVGSSTVNPIARLHSSSAVW